MPAWTINNWIRTPLLIVGSLETLILYSSLYVAGVVVFGSVSDCQEALGALVPKALTVTAISFVSLVAMGLYQFHQRLYFHEAVVRVLVGLFVGCLALAVVFYAVPSVTVSREVAAVAVGYSLFFLLAVRFFFVRTVDENAFRHRTLVYGAGSRASSISDLRRKADRRGFKIVGQISAPGDTIIQHRDKLIELGEKSLAELAFEKGADEIVVAFDDRRGNLPIGELLDAKLKGIGVIDLLEFLERETGKIRIDIVNPGWLIFSPGFRTSRTRRAVKRVLDVIVAALVLLIAWPVMLLIALAIKLEDGPGAPVLYRQIRVGKGGRNFEVLKFRSMTVNAEPDGNAVWASKNDSRITKVGNFLRNSRLDELPQAINVLRGQMSIVGPRPERPEFVDDLKQEIPYYAERHAVKPGVTGWAQLRYSYGASHEDAIEKLQYDLYYIKNQGVILDIMIILQTVEVVLWGKGAR